MTVKSPVQGLGLWSMRCNSAVLWYSLWYSSTSLAQGGCILVSSTKNNYPDVHRSLTSLFLHRELQKPNPLPTSDVHRVGGTRSLKTLVTSTLPGRR